MTSLKRSRGQWLELMLESLDQVPPRMPWEDAARTLAVQLDAPVAGDFGWDAQGRGLVRAYPMPEWFDLADVASRAPDLHPLARHYAETGSHAVRTTSIVGVVGGGAASDYLEELRADGIDQQLWIPVSSLASGPQIIGVCRDADAYSEDQLHIAQLAQRVIVLVHRHVAALSGLTSLQWQDSADALRLTPRQVAVLGLAAEGLTSAAIGRRLHLSPRTVHRHLENAYRRLQVTDRVSAVRRLERAGLLPCARTNADVEPGWPPVRSDVEVG